MDPAVNPTAQKKANSTRSLKGEVNATEMWWAIKNFDFKSEEASKYFHQTRAVRADLNSFFGFG